jgi:hypothetical protein
VHDWQLGLTYGVFLFGIFMFAIAVVGTCIGQIWAMEKKPTEPKTRKRFGWELQHILSQVLALLDTTCIRPAHSQTELMFSTGDLNSARLDARSVRNRYRRSSDPTLAVAMKAQCLVVSVILLLCQAALAQHQPTKVLANGNTSVTASLKGKHLKALFRTTVAPIPNSDSSKQRFAQCTSSRTPCSLTAQIEIFEDGNEVFVPRAAYADLGDISDAELTTSGDRYVLTISGGDASEAYIAKLEFNKERVVKRLLYGAEDPVHPLEISQFYMVSSSD